MYCSTKLILCTLAELNEIKMKIVSVFHFRFIFRAYDGLCKEYEVAKGDI